METFLTEWGTEILLSLVITMLGYFLKQSIKDKQEQEKRYQELIQNEQTQKIDEQIDAHLEPIYKDLEDIRTRLLNVADKEDADIARVNENFELILASYRYRLSQLCKQLLNQGFMYQDQYENLNEFYTLYHKMGGNGQAKNYYEKCSRLEIKVRPDK